MDGVGLVLGTKKRLATESIDETGAWATVSSKDKSVEDNSLKVTKRLKGVGRSTDQSCDAFKVGCGLKERLDVDVSFVLYGARKWESQAGRTGELGKLEIYSRWARAGLQLFSGAPMWGVTARWSPKSTSYCGNRYKGKA